MPVTPPVVLTIAGFDPSSGAGITADIKTIAAHECYGVSCITALTVQSTQGVRRVEGVYPVDPKIVAATLDELLADVTIEAVHIGMLGNEHVVAVVADFLDRARLPHIVLDPILKSSSGAGLLDASGTRLLIERLLPLAELVTPNQVEAGVMTGIAVTDLDQMREAAARLHALGAANVVITGGEPPGVLLAKVYGSAAITNAHPLGKGVGPLQHLYRMSQQRRPSTVVSETEPAHSRN